MIENETSNRAIRLAIVVHKFFRPDLFDSAYQEGLKYKIEQAGIAEEKEKRIPLIFEEAKLKCGCRIDLLVE